MISTKQTNFADIQLLIMDVDGVLTDGGIVIHSDGTESKRFHVIDGHRIHMWHRAGGKSAIISGRKTMATQFRAEQLEIGYVLQDCKQKLPAFEELLLKLGLSASQCAYIGDDLMDIPLVKRAGFGAAVANADPELKAVSDYITTRKGGDGAVGEIVEYLLKQCGKWAAAMDRYLV